MSNASSPLVSVLTPVYNGAHYLAECIDSVRAQTYTKWEYTIVNNCSTDNSLAIAEAYAANDHRIRVINSDCFRPIIDNHNHTLQQMSPAAKYCKFVFADDWLYPSCLEEMVRTAEENAAVGIVGAYTMDGRKVLWPGPQYPCTRVAGREVCRAYLLGETYMFGTMTSLLIRSDICRKREVAFNPHHLHADVEFCLDVLRESDFGFVHQVLSFSRARTVSASTFSSQFNSVSLSNFVMFMKYGPVFLSPAERQQREKKIRAKYHRVLAHNILRGRSWDFWRYHRDTAAALGERISRRLIALLLLADIGEQLLHPLTTIRKGWPWWSEALGRFWTRRATRSRCAP